MLQVAAGLKRLTRPHWRCRCVNGSLNETRPLPQAYTTWASTQPRSRKTPLSVRSPHASGIPTGSRETIHYRHRTWHLYWISARCVMVKRSPRWVFAHSPNKSPREVPRAIARGFYLLNRDLLHVRSSSPSGGVSPLFLIPHLGCLL